jgi:hypothetical protein
VIAAWATTQGAIKVTAARRLPLSGRRSLLLVWSGIVSLIFGLVMFIEPDGGALAHLGLITVFAIVTGAMEIVFALELAFSAAGQRPEADPGIKARYGMEPEVRSRSLRTSARSTTRSATSTSASTSNVHCFPPGQLEAVIAGTAASAHLVTFAAPDVDAEEAPLLGTERMIRADLFHNQPCPTDRPGGPPGATSSPPLYEWSYLGAAVRWDTTSATRSTAPGNAGRNAPGRHRPTRRRLGACWSLLG